jgi:hypothetical protein
MTDSESALIRSAIDSPIAATVKRIPTRRRKIQETVKIKGNEEGKKGRKREQKGGKKTEENKTKLIQKTN